MGEVAVSALKAPTGERKTINYPEPLISPKNYIKKCDSDWVGVVREGFWQEVSTELSPV